MAFIRGSLLILVSILLLVTLFAGNLLLTLSLSLEYENVQPRLVSSVKELIGQEIGLTIEIEEGLEILEEHCQNASEYIIEYQGNTFEVPCDMVNATPESVLEKGAEDYIQNAYYQEYDCDFWDCLEKTEDPSFLISEKARAYWQQKYYFVLLASLVLIVLAFFLVKNKPNWPIVVGSLLVISSLPFMKLEPLFSFLDQTYLQFLAIFISESYAVFWRVFIIGIIALGIGILLHFVDLTTIVAKKIGIKIKQKKAAKSKEKETPKNEKPVAKTEPKK